MKLDIQQLQMVGARGVVFGILNEDLSLNVEDNSQLFTYAKSLGMEVTFHRAFDFVKNPLGSLEKLIELGFDRVLTSGQQPSAFEGIDLIKKLVLQSRGRIQIMAGNGVNSGNVQDLQDTGIDAIHFTARKPVNESFELGMGKRYEVDIPKINSILKVLS
jgi:copper homeostasis protein